MASSAWWETISAGARVWPWLGSHPNGQTRKTKRSLTHPICVRLTPTPTEKEGFS